MVPLLHNQKLANIIKQRFLFTHNSRRKKTFFVLKFTKEFLNNRKESLNQKIKKANKWNDDIYLLSS